MILEYNNYNFALIVSLYNSQQNIQSKWDEYRKKYADSTDSDIKELEEYFNEIFGDKIPHYILPTEIKLYRARQIKSGEWDQVGVNFTKLSDEYFKIFLTEDDIEKAKNLDFEISLECLFYLKCFGLKEFDEHHVKKFNELIEQNSVQEYFYGFPESGCGVPPESYRSPGRLSTVEDAYLYLALERDTAIYEMRPLINQFYSLATFQTKKELKLVDLRSTDDISAKDTTFSVNAVSSKISEPNTDKDVRFYRITQCLSHFLQGKGYNGIIYSSALKKNGTNIMLFDDENVDVISSDIVSIDDIHIDFTTQLPIQNNQSEDNET